MSKHRYPENAEVIAVDAAGTDFTATVSGAVAHGTVFFPFCTADRGEKLKLRIQLPDGNTFKAEGRVSQLRKHPPVPGCLVAWIAPREKSVDAVRAWLSGEKVMA